MLLASRFGVALLASLLLAGTVLAVEGDVIFRREGASESATAPSFFPHWVHRIRYKCYACHPDIFQMKTGSEKVTMAAIQEGKYCGVCHNGDIAWGVGMDTCNRCHAGQ